MCGPHTAKNLRASRGACAVVEPSLTRCSAGGTTSARPSRSSRTSRTPFRTGSSGYQSSQSTRRVRSQTSASSRWVDVDVNNTELHPAGFVGTHAAQLGGTVGDIESAPFIEAMRQFQFRVGHDNFALVYVSLIPVVGGEQKTKPTQAGVRDLRGLGLLPDLVRAARRVPAWPLILPSLAPRHLHRSPPLSDLGLDLDLWCTLYSRSPHTFPIPRSPADQADRVPMRGTPLPRDDGESVHVLPRLPQAGARRPQRLVDVPRPAPSPGTGSARLLPQEARARGNPNQPGPEAEGADAHESLEESYGGVSASCALRNRSESRGREWGRWIGANCPRGKRPIVKTVARGMWARESSRGVVSCDVEVYSLWLGSQNTTPDPR